MRTLSRDFRERILSSYDREEGTREQIAVRLCFLAYRLSARLGSERRQKGVKEEVPRILRQLQTIRLGRLQTGKQVHRTLMTQIPKHMNEQLQKLGLAGLFAAPPQL